MAGRHRRAAQRSSAGSSSSTLRADRDLRVMPPAGTWPLGPPTGALVVQTASVTGGTFNWPMAAFRSSEPGLLRTCRRHAAGECRIIDRRGGAPTRQPASRLASKRQSRRWRQQPATAAGTDSGGSAGNSGWLWKSATVELFWQPDESRPTKATPAKTWTGFVPIGLSPSPRILVFTPRGRPRTSCPRLPTLIRVSVGLAAKNGGGP